MLAVYNFTPVPRDDYRIGVGVDGEWTVLLDTDAEELGGSGFAAERSTVTAEARPAHGRPYSVSVRLPPLGAVFLTPT